MTSETETFGVHLMLDGYGADPALLADRARLAALLHDLPRALGMHAIAEPVVVEVGPKNRKDPGGLSGVVLIAESHVSFHTFPSRGFVTIDVYTCQADLDRDRVAALLTQGFGIRSCDVFVQPRGLRYPTSDLGAPATSPDPFVTQGAAKMGSTSVEAIPGGVRGGPGSPFCSLKSSGSQGEGS